MYERLTKLSIDEVFSAIKENRELVFAGRPMQYSVRVLTYFAHGVDCICKGCTVKGAYFAVERQINRKTGLPNTLSYHLNFYGLNEDGEEIMMTSDHKMPKSQGGSLNGLHNRQPMCTICNCEKGNQLIYT
jgi:hypothetical protein